MPELDAWTISNSAVLEPKQGRVKEIGINLAAPGDRRSPSGMMWLEFPTVSGDSPNLKVSWSGNARLFQDHPSAQATSEVPWITSSGIEGLSELKIDLVAQPRHSLAKGWPIDHVADDAKENAQGDVDLDSSGLELLDKSNQSQWIGLRFDNIRLAKGSSIRSAHLQLTAKAAAEKAGSIQITAQASGHADRFSTTPKNISSRPTLSEKVQWDVGSWKAEGSAGKDERSPDIASLLQSIVNRDDWQPGNAIVIMLRGEGAHAMAAYRAADPAAAKLIVDADELELVSDSDREPMPYRVQLHFGLPRDATAGERSFAVKIGEQSQAVTLDAVQKRTSKVTFPRVDLSNTLSIQFDARSGQPVISGVELQQLNSRADGEGQ